VYTIDGELLFLVCGEQWCPEALRHGMARIVE
jgi:hypothetical protein